MSVINQMLKDLEQRQGDQQTDSSASVMPVIATKPPLSNILIVIVSVFITLVAVYMYYLHTENQRLASQSSQISSVEKVTLKKIAPPLVVQTHQSVTNDLSKVAIVSQQVTPKTIELEVKDKVTKPPSESHISNLPSASLPESKVVESKVAVKQSKPKFKQQSTMVITRKQLTPETLAKQKMSRAKEAVANNNIAKAEQLFEDVLLILPTNKDARKQLAALWFGRQSYQGALNLLSQGIHLDPTDSELRLLKAQIHIKQQQYGAAFQILQSHPKLNEVAEIKYQSMLATQAQNSKQYQFAAQAYQRLTKLQSVNGRWWLGLAIAYDSDSQFKLARQTYHTALNKQDLSSSARQFVNQRLQELGE